MITQNYLTLTPAYGRDYRSQTAVASDFLAGKDFIHPSGSYCSIRDFAPNVQVSLRYSRLSKVHVITTPSNK